MRVLMMFFKVKESIDLSKVLLVLSQNDLEGHCASHVSGYPQKIGSCFGAGSVNDKNPPLTPILVYMYTANSFLPSGDKRSCANDEILPP